MNENGRYQINKKICTNFTSYHKESWTPAWTIATMLKAIIAHFEVEDSGIGSIKKDKKIWIELAKKSVNYHCNKCGSI